MLYNNNVVKITALYSAGTRYNLIFASMAQLVEQRIRNAQVVGSNPTTSSKGLLHKVRQP